MVIRQKNRKNNMIDQFVAADEVDYWVDTQKMALYISIRGKQMQVGKSRQREKLLQGLDRIYDAVQKDGFIDLTKVLNG